MFLPRPTKWSVSHKRSLTFSNFNHFCTCFSIHTHRPGINFWSCKVNSPVVAQSIMRLLSCVYAIFTTKNHRCALNDGLFEILPSMGVRRILLPRKLSLEKLWKTVELAWFEMKTHFCNFHELIQNTPSSSVWNRILQFIFSVNWEK